MESRNSGLAAIYGSKEIPKSIQSEIDKIFAIPQSFTEPAWNRLDAIQSVRNISYLTGGRAAIHRDIGDALERVNETTRIEYLLGYYPKDDRWDGRYRQINVKVNRPGVKVSFRHGYYARDALQPYDRKEFLAFSRISAAAGYEPDLEDIPFKIATSEIKDDDGRPQIKVDLQIDPAKVEFRTVNGRHSGTLRIVVFYADASRHCLGEEWKTMDMQLQEETYLRFMQSSIPFSTMIPLKVPKLILKVVVYDPGNDKVGSKLVKMR